MNNQYLQQAAIAKWVNSNPAPVLRLAPEVTAGVIIIAIVARVVMAHKAMAQVITMAHKAMAQVVTMAQVDIMMAIVPSV